MSDINDPYMLTAFAKPIYDQKDTMHDWSHIKRCASSAKKIIMNNSVVCDPVLLSGGLILHGLVYEDSMEEKVSRYLSDNRVDEEKIKKITLIARDSQKETCPETIEGGILHDAHLLEGDDGFIITKVLVTGTARGQNLDQTVAYFFESVLTLNPTFYLPSSEGAYNVKLKKAESFFNSLRNVL